MNIKTIAGMAAIVAFATTAAHADYHTVLLGTRLHLSTTTFQNRVSVSTKTENGFTELYSSQKPDLVKMPSDVVDGYIAWISADPSVAFSSNGLTGKGDAVLFYFASELVRLQYPNPGLANTQTLQGIFIPRNIIKSAEHLKLPFEGDAGMGEPFFVPAWQAKLMSTSPPVFACAPRTEQGNVFFVSYNESVGEKELSPLCEKTEIDTSAFGIFAKKKNVFGFSYPAD
jgi:hypothetical protein